MKSDYARLLQAAKELQKWDSPTTIAAQLTLGGYRVSEQMMTNWKTRGLSETARLKASPIIGCRPHWLETGQGEMRDVHLLANVLHGKAHSLGLSDEFHPDDSGHTKLAQPSALVVAAMRLDRSPAVSDETKAALTALLKSLLSNPTRKPT